MQCYTQGKKKNAHTLLSLKITFLELASFKYKTANSHFLTCQRKSYIKGISQALRFIKVSG